MYCLCRTFFCISIVTSIIGPLSHRAECADTVETWETGATDLDFYLGAGGMRTGSSTTYSSDTMLGYGLANRFSAYLGVAMETDSNFDEGGTALYTGFFGTPISTDHFDADLFLNLESSGPNLSEMRVTPSLELNLDGSDDMSSFGFYFRGGAPLFAREKTTATGPEEEAEKELSYILEGTVGAYLTVFSRHQLLVELDGSADPDRDNRAKPGSVALGYNVVLNDSLELINTVAMDIPRDDQKAAVKVVLGFIATMTPWN